MKPMPRGLDYRSGGSAPLSTNFTGLTAPHLGKPHYPTRMRTAGSWLSCARERYLGFRIVLGSVALRRTSDTATAGFAGLRSYSAKAQRQRDSWGSDRSAHQGGLLARPRCAQALLRAQVAIGCTMPGIPSRNSPEQTAPHDCQRGAGQPWYWPRRPPHRGANR